MIMWFGERGGTLPSFYGNYGSYETYRSYMSHMSHIFFPMGSTGEGVSKWPKPPSVPRSFAIR